MRDIGGADTSTISLVTPCIFYVKPHANGHQSLHRSPSSDRFSVNPTNITTTPALISKVAQIDKVSEGKTTEYSQELHKEVSRMRSRIDSSRIPRNMTCDSQ
jgi:hypothetical protein